MNVGQGNPFRLTPSKDEHRPRDVLTPGGSPRSLDQQAQQPGGRTPNTSRRWSHSTRQQFHKFVEHESTGAYFAGGTLTHPGGLGNNAYVDTLSAHELARTYVVVLRGHDLFTVYSQELTTEANLVTLAVDVYKKI